MNEEYINLAQQLFDNVRELLEKPNRTEEENYLMVHMAHTSLYHWMDNGTPNNIYRGEWQISRVYTVLNNFDSSLYHGKRALKLCEENGFTGIDLAYAYEALSRANLIKENRSQSLIYLELALNEAAKITDQDSKELVLADLREIQGKCSNI
jgi:hypothetical protein